VRALVNIIAADTQPVTNLRILQRADRLGASKEDWSRELQEQGLAAYERVIAATAGKYSVGDSITLADVCLVPAVWGAVRWGVDMTAFPTIQRIYEEMDKEPAVQEAHWAKQADTPEGLRQ
jgi:maleylacetoacetate isomerase